MAARASGGESRLEPGAWPGGGYPCLALPKSRDTGSMQSSSKIAFLTVITVNFSQPGLFVGGFLGFLFFFFPFGFLVVFFSPNISFVAEDYIPNGVFLSAVSYTVLLFKELAWIVTTLQAGNLVGTLLSCLLIYC